MSLKTTSIFRKNSLHHRSIARPGVSALIAIMIVMAFMIMMSSVMVAMMRSLKIAQGGANADQAYLNAVTGLELGLYAQNKPNTFEALAAAIDPTYDSEKSPVIHINPTPTDGNTPNDATEDSTVTFKAAESIPGSGQICGDEAFVYSQTTYGNDKEAQLAACNQNKVYYVYPFPGTGDLGSSYCNPANQSVVKDEQWYRDAYFYLKGSPYIGQDPILNLVGNGTASSLSITATSTDQEIINYAKSLSALDHPCLWNTLTKESAVEIPLSNGINGPQDLSNFWLRVRMPCKGGILCGSALSGRVALYVDQNNSEELKTSALSWNIVGSCKNSGEDNTYLCHIEPRQNTDTTTAQNDTTYSAITKWLLSPLGTSSKIYGSSSVPKNTVLSMFNSVTNKIEATPNDPSLSNTLQGIFTHGINSASPYFINPKMHLGIAINLTTIEGTEIPHVEYQILYQMKSGLTKETALISNPTVISTGHKGGYTINLESSLTKQTGAFGFAVIGK